MSRGKEVSLRWMQTMLPEDLSTNTRALSFAAIDNAPVAALMWDRAGSCLFANKKWCELTQTSPGENSGTGWLTPVFPADRKELLAAIKESEGSVSIHLINHTTQIAVSVRLSAASPSSVIGWIEINSLDQPLRKKDPSNFVHRADFVEAVLDSTVSLISVVDRNFNLIFYNQQTEAYTGVSKDSVLGRNVFEVFPHLANNADFRNNVLQALSGKTIQSPVQESTLKQGKYFENFYIPLRDENGEVVGVILKVRDRTIDTKLQQQLIETNKLLEEQNKSLVKQSHFIQSLFDSTIDVIAVIDTELRYISINKKAVERYGYTKEEIAGKKILDLFPSVKDSGMYRDIQRALKGEFVHDLSYTSEVLNKARFENYYVPLFDENNIVYAVMIIGHDITQIMQANEKLKISNAALIQKNRDLERSNNDLEQFAYVASHDLQEPIRKIATYSNKLLTRSKEHLNEETTVYLQRISNSTRRMYELINGLLSYSRLTREENLFTKTSIGDIVRQLIIDFDLKIRDKKAIVNIQNKLPDLEAIPVQMTQLFANLLSNSLKFAKADVTPVIQIASSDLDPEQVDFYKLDPRGKYVTLFYVDNGIGFDQQFAEKIFDLFQRLHEKTKYEGSGIGLAICKKIITNHHGFITVYSEEGKGATFQMILPYFQNIKDS